MFKTIIATVCREQIKCQMMNWFLKNIALLIPIRNELDEKNKIHQTKVIY